MERTGFDRGKYQQTALNFRYTQSQRASSEAAPAAARSNRAAANRSFPKPPVSDRFEANPENSGSRRGTDIDAIMLHHTAGSTASGAAGALNSRGLSAHYVIDKDGTIYQMVGDEKRAFHAGGGSIRGDGRDINDRSIGIEIVNRGDGRDQYTEAQYKALEKLVPHLARKYDIPVENIVGHSQTGNPNRPASSPEPSRNFDWERVRRSVTGDAPAPNPPAPNPAPPNPKPDKPSGVTAPTAFLERGANNGQVKQLQDALVKLGYMKRGEIGGGYGNFGPKTERALKAFQRDHKDGNGRPLAADGIYGPLTRGAMRRSLARGGDNPSRITAPTAFLNRGDNSGQVKKLQDALVKLDYMERGEIGGGYGNFGPKTERALKEFQRDHKDSSGRQLVADGIYGPKTRKAMQKALRNDKPEPKPNPAPNPAPNPNPSPGGDKVDIDKIADVKNNPNVTPAFLREVNAMAKRLDTKPEYLLAVMSFESGLDPTNVNEVSGATGLIQFLDETAQGLGTSTAALKDMSSIEQLKFVEKYLKPFKGKLETLEGVYTSVLSGSPKPNPNDVLFSSGTQAYSQNKGLDFNRNGRITSGEATSAVAAKMFGGTRQIQQKLKDLGFDPKGVDGEFGASTSKAVAAFQKSRKLPATGLLNERTGLALMNAKRPTKPDNDGNDNKKPSGRPAQGSISSDFGPRAAPVPGASTNHQGVDFDAPTGARVQSTAPGKVVHAGPLGTAGNAVIIDHGNGYQTKYFHLSEINVQVGQRVGDSQKIGEVGETGNVSGAHLHYEVHYKDQAVDPEKFL